MTYLKFRRRMLLQSWSAAIIVLLPRVSWRVARNVLVYFLSRAPILTMWWLATGRLNARPRNSEQSRGTQALRIAPSIAALNVTAGSAHVPHGKKRFM